MRKYHKQIISFVAFLIVSSVIYFFSPKDEVILHSCIDGDTAKFKIKNEVKTVRFLAINAPETAKEAQPAEPFGEKASEYACQHLKQAKKIRLEYEKEVHDRHGRTLAWVFLDDQLFNEKIVKEGLARVAYLYDKYRYTAIIKQAEKSAKNKKLNIWK